jgi:predicted DNA-binding WGR domain protein
MAPRRSNRIKEAAAPTKSRRFSSKQTKKRAIVTKKQRKNSSQSAVDTSTVLGVVDPISKIKGTIEILDNEPCDCMLVHLDRTSHVDRFFILQLIHGVRNSYYVYSRWGRTGTSGQGIVQKCNDYDDAVETFENKFREKTGLEWENRNAPTRGGKYRVIQQNFVEKQRGYTSAKWQYWVDDGIDGKKTGWYDYDKFGSRNVEQLYQENLTNFRLTDRLVDSGAWTYHVDLNNMTQTNTMHANKTTRHIRRYVVPANRFH